MRTTVQHGFELACITREDVPTIGWASEHVLSERITVSFRSTGTMLQQREVRFKPEPGDAAGRTVQHPWQSCGRDCRDPHSVILARARAAVARAAEMGWTVSMVHPSLGVSL